MNLHSNRALQPDDSSVICYLNEVPPFIEAGLAGLYGMLQSSLPFFEVFRSMEGVHCYVARRDGQPSAILLFSCRDRRIEVLNEMIGIEQAELQRFAHHVFASFPQAALINFKALQTRTDGFAYPVQKYNAKDTYVIQLPETPEKYIASIGKSTRASLRQQLNALARNFPSFQAVYLEGEEADENALRAIAAFSEDKIKAKGVAFSHDLARITALVRQCGFVAVMSIDGRICGGTINYRVGTSYFGDVTGYDPEFEKHGFGKLCVYQTICESIRRGGTRFYLGGGAFDFKQRLLGVPVTMDEIRIYRSYWALLANLDKAAQTVARASVRQLKKLVHRHQKKLLGRLVYKSFHLFKSRLQK